MSNTIETKLLQLGKWTINCVRIIGYLPLAIKSNHSQTPKNGSSSSLHFKIRRISVIFTLTLLISCVVWETVFFNNVHAFLHSGIVKIFGPTEKYAHHFYVIMTSLIGVIFRVAGLCSGQKTITFWKSNCLTLEKVENSLGYFKRDLLDEEEFQRIKKILQRVILLNALVISIQIIGVHGSKMILTIINNNGWSTGTEFNIGAGFWNVLVLLHTFYSTTWLAFFILIYTAGFTCIAKKIRSLQELMKELPGGVYASEIFRIKKLSKSISEVEDDLSGNKVLESKLVQCVDAFIILEQEVHNFNQFFGARLILEMVHCITHLVVDSFFASVWIGRGILTQVVQIVIPFGVYLNQLYSLGTVAGEMTLAAQKVSTALFENVQYERLNAETRLKLQMLITKIGNGPPVISARHFFTVNRHLITSVLSAMTTFLVVLVQFKDGDDEPSGVRPIFQFRPMNMSMPKKV